MPFLNPTTMTSTFKPFSESHLPAINHYLDTLITKNYTDSRQQLEAAIRHSLLAPGKRVRPLLCIATHKLFTPLSPGGGAWGEVASMLPAAAALELIHTYSLIHDDLPAMDNDDFRRGISTCHKAFDEATAILAGDALNTLAFQHLAEVLPQFFPAESCLQAINYLGKAAGEPGMVGGQILDIYSSDTQKDLAYLETLHLCKTGALIRASIVLPAILNQADAKTIEKLEHFGESIGLLFQVVDDILDVISDKDTLGKTPNKDAKQNKLTYVSLLGLDGAKKKAQLIHDEARDLLDFFDSDTAVLADFVAYLFKRQS